jgi:hypothetical protein
VSLGRYRFEWLVLVLVALAMLPLVSVVGAQDTSRLALTEPAVLRGHVDIDPYWQLTTDRAFQGGRWYSDKAPGVGLLAVPLVAAMRVGEATRRVWTHAWLLWAIRLRTGGLALLALTFLVGRVAEGLVRGAGLLTAVVFAVGTMAGSNRLEFRTWPGTVWSLLGLSRELGALILLVRGAAAGLVALVASAGGPRPEPVVHSFSP